MFGLTLGSPGCSPKSFRNGCRMHVRFPLAVVLIAQAGSVGLLSRPLEAQALTAVDPGHIIAYLDFHEALSAEIQKRNSATPNGGRALLDGILEGMHISEADLRIVVDRSRALKADLAIVDADSAAYKNTLRQTQAVPDPQRVREFSQRRKAAVQRAADRLQQDLSPAGWQAFVDHFQPTFMKSITTWRVTR